MYFFSWIAMWYTCNCISNINTSLYSYGRKWGLELLSSKICSKWEFDSVSSKVEISPSGICIDCCSFLCLIFHMTKAESERVSCWLSSALSIRQLSHHQHIKLWSFSAFCAAYYVQLCHIASWFNLRFSF